MSLQDIKEIAMKLGYMIHGPKEKYRYGEFDSYRIYISTHDAERFYNDILKMSLKFPTCNLVHKMTFLHQIVLRQNRGYLKSPDGNTKNRILELLNAEPLGTANMAKILNIGHSSVREHLQTLEKEGKIKKIRILGKRALIFEKID